MTGSEPVEYPPALAGADVASPQSPAEMLQRLNEAEYTIAAIKAQLQQEPGAETEPGNVFGFLGERWKTLGDLQAGRSP